MKVLVVSAAYPAPSDPVRAVAIENLHRMLQTAEAVGGQPSIETTVVAPRIAPGDPVTEVRAGIPIRRFRFPSGGKRLKEMGKPSLWTLGWYLLRGLGAVLRETRRHESDVVLCHWVVPTGPIAAAACRMLRRPLVLVAHGSDVNRYANSSWAAGRMARFALKRAQAVVAVSRDLEERLLRDFSVDKEKVTVLPMGVDASLFRRRPDGSCDSPSHPVPHPIPHRRRLRARLGLPSETPVLLYVGDLIEEKGVPELIEAHAQLVGSGVNVELRLVGEGPLREGIQRRCANRDAGLRLEGRQSQENLADWYAAADALVLPSHAEGTPVVIMEALACGLPVVATAVGGIPDLISEGESGRLVDPKAGRSLEVVLRELLRGNELRALRARLAALEVDYSIERRAVALRDILRGVVGERAEPREEVKHA